jgi:hypothetical protein
MFQREYLLGFAAACGLAMILSFTGRTSERAPVVTTSEALPTLPEERLENEGPLIRDPFFGTMLTTDEPQAAALSLEGIIWDDAVPLAIINGEVVGTGAAVAEHIVVSIQQDRVTLSKDTETVVLTL